jgi:hypothetical protein
MAQDAFRSHEDAHCKRSDLPPQSAHARSKSRRKIAATSFVATIRAGSRGLTIPASSAPASVWAKQSARPTIEAITRLMAAAGVSTDGVRPRIRDIYQGPPDPPAEKAQKP